MKTKTNAPETCDLEVAMFALGVCAVTVHRMVTDGRLKACKIGKGAKRYDVASLMALVEARARRPEKRRGRPSLMERQERGQHAKGRAPVAFVKEEV